MLLVFNRTKDFANIHTFSESTKDFWNFSTQPRKTAFFFG